MSDLVLIPDDRKRPDAAELAELARLTSIEDERCVAPLRHGPIETLAVLRRRYHGREAGMLEVVELPACGLVVASNDGSAAWAAHGLGTLSDLHLELFRRKALELVGAVTREQVQREVQHG